VLLLIQPFSFLPPNALSRFRLHCRLLRPPGNASLPPTKTDVVSQFAFTLPPAALPALASVLILRLFFSASAQVNEKNQSSKEAQEKSS
jgi:hypothetical protein